MRRCIQIGATRGNTASVTLARANALVKSFRSTNLPWRQRERMTFNAQVALDERNDAQAAGQEAYLAMIKAAKAIVQIQYDDVTDDPEEVVDEFRERYFDTELIFDPFAGPKFADYLFAAYENADRTHSAESAHHLIEEAQLFIEAVHACYNRIRSEGLTGAQPA